MTGIKSLKPMIKKLLLSMLMGLVGWGVAQQATAQSQVHEKTVDHKVSVEVKQQDPEKYQPRPQSVQNKISPNPIRKKDLNQEIKDIEKIIKGLETLPFKTDYNEKKLERLKKTLAEKKKEAAAAANKN